MLTFPLPVKYPHLGLHHVLVFERGDHDNHTLIAPTLESLVDQFQKVVTPETRVYEYLFGDVVPPTKRMADRYAQSQRKILIDNSRYSLLWEVSTVVDAGYPVPRGFVRCPRHKPDCSRCSGYGLVLQGGWRKFVASNPQVLDRYHQPESGTIHIPEGKGNQLFVLVQGGWSPDRVYSYPEWCRYPQTGNVLCMRVMQTEVPKVFDDLILACRPVVKVKVEVDPLVASAPLFAKLEKILEFPAI